MAFVPYAGDTSPKSGGRIFLADLLDEVLLFTGYPTIIGLGGFPRRNAEQSVEVAIELLGHLFQSGVLRTYSRPIEGGEVLEIPVAQWEFDDFRGRFEKASFDPIQWVNGNEPTHFIFVDVDDVERFFASWRSSWEPSDPVSADAITDVTPDTPAKMLRLPEVLDRTGVRKSTLYDWINRGAFPKPKKLGERSVGWPENEIDRWISERQVT